MSSRLLMIFFAGGYRVFIDFEIIWEIALQEKTIMVDNIIIIFRDNPLLWPMAKYKDYPPDTKFISKSLICKTHSLL